MALMTCQLSLSTWTLSLGRGRGRAARVLAGAGLVAAAGLGTALPAVAATPPTLVVVILGSGAVLSQPAGIACPGKCTATFAAGTSVRLTPNSKDGSSFLRWGGSCTGRGGCTVNVSTLTAVAAQFVGGPGTPPAPTTGKYVAVPGPYSGSSGQGFGLTLYVAPGGKSVQNVFIPDVNASCTPSGSIGNTVIPVGIPTVAVQPNGSFSSRTSQSGVINGNKATFTYTFAGRFQAATTTSTASAAGTWSEHIAFASGTLVSCSSNNQNWAATLYREPPWQKSVIEPGNYAGSSGQGFGVTFSVAPGGKSVQNVSIPDVNASCTPSGNLGNTVIPVGIRTIPVQPNGSFSAKTSQTGVINGSNVKFTYTFAGYFEGPTPPAGAATVAGTWREDVVFTSGATTMCTSNNQSWTATRS